MFKAYAPQFKKPYIDQNDSVEELETLQTEDGSIPRALPESCSMTKNLFISKAHNLDSPSRNKVHLVDRGSPNHPQVRTQSPEHKSDQYYSLTTHQQAYQYQGHYDPSSITQFPSQSRNNPDHLHTHSTVVNKEIPTRAREYSFNPKGDFTDAESPYTELAQKIFNEKFSSNSSSATGVNRSGGKQQTYGVEADLGAAMVKQLSGCTFTPNVNDTKNHRSLNQFLESQKQHLDRVEAKKKKIAEEQLQEQIREGGNHRPEICQKSVKILEKKKQQDKGPAYERLYNSSKKPKVNAEADNYESAEVANLTVNLNEGDNSALQRKNSKPGNNQKLFRPEIQKKSKIMKREDKVDNLLYNDALRRQNKFNDAPKTTKTKSTSVTMSSTSKRAIATRFIKEFDIVVEEFFDLGKKQTFNYIQLNEFLTKLCFLKTYDNVDNPRFVVERGLLYDSWYILNASKYKGVHRRNLLVFLLGVLNLHFPITKIIKDERDNSPSEYGQDRSHNPLLTEENEPLSKSLNQSFHPVLPEGLGPREKVSIGIFDEEGNYELTEEEVRELHNLFEPWYINRLCTGDNLGQYMSRKSQEEHSFHPEINQASKDLAQNYREKLLTGTAELIQQNKVLMPKDGKLTHADLLIVSKKVIEEKVNRYGELIKEEQAKDLTFQPQISQYTSVTQGDGERKSVYSRKEKSMTPEPMGKERVFELHALAKLRSAKQDKSPRQREYEKGYEECTFQPNKYLDREAQAKKSNNSTNYFAKGIDKSVERIRNARTEKEQQALAARSSRQTYEGQFVCSMDRSMRNTSKERNTSKDRTPTKERRSKSPISNMRDTPSRTYSQANVRRDTYEDQRSPYLFHDQNKKQHYEGFDYELEEANEAKRNLAFASEAGQTHHAYTEEHQKRGPSREITPFLQDKIDDNEDDRVPLLFVDVNLGLGKNERITVFEGDTAEGLAQKFSEEYGLEPLMKTKLKELLDMQIAGLLSRIEEELHSGYSETERHKNHY